MYRLSLDDLQRIADMRGTGGDGPLGSAHFVGQLVPMVVTRITFDLFGEGRHGVNGQALLDGADRLWVTSAREGDEPGQWFAEANDTVATAGGSSDTIASADVASPARASESSPVMASESLS